MKEKTAQENINALAARFGMDPELIQGWVAGKDEVQASPECLTLAEIRSLPFVAEQRKEHVESCEFCSSLLNLLLPSDDEVEEFHGVRVAGDWSMGHLERRPGLLSLVG